MALQVLQLQEIKPPPELAAALSANFLDRLGIASPPPVQIAALEQWGGYCHEENATERGEVIISDWRTPRPSWSIAHGIQGTYMHEAAHRLIWQADYGVEGHGIEFFALQLLLFRRAGKREDDYPWFLFFKGYDLLDSLEARGTPGIPSAGEAVDWAMELALELADQKITAELAAQEICRRAKAWRDEVAAAPGRREAAQKAAREKIEALKTSLSAARDKIFWWRIYFSIASFFALIFLGISISLR